MGTTTEPSEHGFERERRRAASVWNTCSIRLLSSPLMTEPGQANCVSCAEVVTFDNQPGDTVCPTRSHG